MVRASVKVETRTSLLMWLKHRVHSMEEWLLSPPLQVEVRASDGGDGPPPGLGVRVLTQDAGDWDRWQYFFGGLFILFWAIVILLTDEGPFSDTFSGVVFLIGASAVLRCFWPAPYPYTWKYVLTKTIAILLCFLLLLHWRG